MNFQFGIDNLLANPDRLSHLRGASVGLIAHPASVTSDNRHSLDALKDAGCNIVRAFGPQHGMRGDKQDNMIESDNYLDPVHNIPVISLYGKYRRPTPEMIADLDVVLFDLQDVGCRIYTYITTLYYFCEACAGTDTEFWILDRPNPAGRPIDGLFLEQGEESFVGCAQLPTRHGLTIGELASWFLTQLNDSLNLKVLKMSGYQPESNPGFGWPVLARPWINPSPNAASVNMTRCFSGTVLLEGTTLSEGRGTTVPLEVIGAPELPIEAILNDLTNEVPEWLEGAYLRPCYFSPTFQKHTGVLCSGIQIHTDFPEYKHDTFKPYRLIAAILKSLRNLSPEAEIWRYHDYEYELDRTPIDVINGGPYLRQWVDNPAAGYSALHHLLAKAESAWHEARRPHLIYP